MEIKFFKYHGTGNDFVMINQFDAPEFDLNAVQIKHICDRRFGVGADGLILIRKDETQDFKMVYFNSDGHQSSMCGNGGRCIVKFAHDLGFIDKNCSFTAIDGVHKGEINNGLVKIDMKDVDLVEREEEDCIMDTGSPHYVFETTEELSIEAFKIKAISIRNSERFRENGINVNAFIQLDRNYIKGLTYERGVEDITFSCGTGVVAMAIAYIIGLAKPGDYKVKIDNLGGALSVELTYRHDEFMNVFLIGPATKVFEGKIKFS